MIEDERVGTAEKTIKVNLWLRVENNNKFVRGKTMSRLRIEESILNQYDMVKLRPDGWEYHLTIKYRTDEELNQIIYEDILQEAERMADLRNGFTEADVTALDGSERSW